MIDFHSHVLPRIDDGADSVETSLAMLRESRRQGVDLLYATPHFYADEMNPASFLRHRDHAWSRLREAMAAEEGSYPEVRLGAEILYFPGMSEAEELVDLTMEGTPFLLVEPPMMPWSDYMLDEVEQIGDRLKRIPVIAHLDRYMVLLHDDSLFERVRNRKMLIQVNASFFLYERTQAFALDCLKTRKFQFIGSDCHNLSSRAPNMGDAADVIRRAGQEADLEKLEHAFYEHFSFAAV